MKTTLYKQDVTGEIREWSVERVDDETYIITWGLHGGALQEQYEKVKENQSGRELKEQMMLEMASRISKRRDQGYVNSIQKALEPVTNSINMPRPMLAQKYQERLIPEDFFVQYKYDGNRCLITKQNNKVFAYSRNGKIINSINHITNAARFIPEGTILDGELYHHGTPLQTLRSWIAKGQADSMNLVYMCYDIMMNASTIVRFDTITNIGLIPPIFIAPTYRHDRKDLIPKQFRIARDHGYEGLIVRDVNSHYEAGKRSKSLIKVKEWHSDEFLVTGVEPSRDNWGILVCTDKNSKQFKVSAPGSIPDKEYVLANSDHYIGQQVTVEYANLTKDGIPFHPVAIAFRLSGE